MPAKDVCDAIECVFVEARMKQIIAFGNPVYDEIITPAVRTAGRVLSGCSTNACLALTRLGRPTALVGRVGNADRERLEADLARYGVASHTDVCPATGGFRLIYNERGQRTLDVLGVADPITSIPAECMQASAVIIGPILQETPPSLIHAIHAATSAPLILDPQGMLRRFGADGRIEHYCPPEFRQFAPYCRVIKANEVEAHVLTGIDPRVDPGGAARALRAYGCAIAIVTIAEAGSIIDDGAQQYRIPAYPTDARDPTGAGDTYMAGFLDAYLRDPADLYGAGCYGAATASIWIEHTGPDAPITPAEVQRRAATLLAQRHR
jgi:sugar/nucleoside kinase (ribokinase family)